MLKRWGDRKDGTYLKKIDSMHTIMPLMYPNRCDNEAFLTERIDLTNINAYLERKNAGNTEYAYNLFQIMVTALLKVITLRPKMNRFIANKTIYQRNEVSAAFTVKKEFSDDGGEALAFIHAKDSDNINTIHDEIFRQVPGDFLEFHELAAGPLRLGVIEYPRRGNMPAAGGDGRDPVHVFHQLPEVPELRIVSGARKLRRDLVRHFR